MRRVLVWDLPLRICHWGLAAAVVAAFVSQWVGAGSFVWHRWAGITVLVLVLFRLMWGFLGTRYARFAEFLVGPRRMIQGMAELAPSRHVPQLGHTATGGWMIVVLLVMLATQAALGLLSNDEVMDAGPLAGYVSHTTSNTLSAIHRAIAYGILFVSALHVVAVIYYRWVLGENLVAPMISGWKTTTLADAGIRHERRGLALGLLLLVVGVLGLVLWLAPPVPEVLF